jgi:hypothetical protein
MTQKKDKIQKRFIQRFLMSLGACRELKKGCVAKLRKIFLKRDL